MHVLPQLRELEERFPSELVVLGIHTGKYVAERETARIRDAAQRLDVEHPILNDRQYRVWRSFAVRAWPTLVVVDPAGGVLGSHAGEFTAEMLAPLIERLIQRHAAAGRIDRSRLEFPRDESSIAPGVLRYPAKIAVDGDRVAIADTGHHRILLGTVSPSPTGESSLRASAGPRPRTLNLDYRFVTTYILGDGQPGFVNGGAPRFHSPTGVAFAGGVLYVADTENHAIRGVDLRDGTVYPAAGTGQQMRTSRDRAAGALSSPWDVAIHGETVCIAMAGTHQLWALRAAAGRVETGDTFGAEPIAGAGAEDLADGAAGDARLAQPMGVTAAAGAPRLYFVDAETSAVRWLDPGHRLAEHAGGDVGTIVGTGLFEFGDQDGVGDAVRLQHPQGVAAHPGERLLVADSYNDAVKRVNPDTREVETVVRGLHEPGGLAYDPRLHVTYIADTNAHRIVVLDDSTGTTSVLDVVVPEPV